MNSAHHYDEAKQRLLDEEMGSPLLSPPRGRSPRPVVLMSPSLRRTLMWFGIVSTLCLCYFATRRNEGTSRKPLSYRETFHRPPASPLNQDAILVKRPTRDHTVTAILLHGLGDIYRTTPAALTAVLSERYDYVKWVAPQARLINSTVSGGVPTSAWYNIETFADLHQNEDENGMIESQREINQLIQEERDALIRIGREPRIVVAGFSQGAVMTMLNVLVSTDQLEAAILLSGYLPLPKQTQQLGSTIPHDLPVWWGHGEADPFLTEIHASEDVATLREAPYSLSNLEYKTYAHVEHYWSPEELEDMARWFGEHAPRERSTGDAKAEAKRLGQKGGRRRHFSG
ncbi:Phospholipase/Carboxylesterase-domain-containing protein [Leucosporidium creatinivorum]|uniref:Acyl-protein thioesterase 1 n=1 Tax=Leucosporidium creatinivorum TaxID=106004 RepID=A0A1Y2FZ86_9BASI|nr:Phospholipase/Carboxylesterase-domain-containing protein [Leucosporidium creatinivorum]